MIAIYDADNTPEPNALRYLVGELIASEEYGAVIGKFRTRNRNASLLTRFINIETLAFQWMAQAGRFQLFKLCTIPGTNFIVRRSIIEAIGGWDDKALAEDTEISFRIYMMGYKIKFQPKAVTWGKSHKLCQFGSDNGRDGSKAIFMSLLKMLNYCLILKRVGSVLIFYISCPFIFS